MRILAICALVAFVLGGDASASRAGAGSRPTATAKVVPGGGGLPGSPIGAKPQAAKRTAGSTSKSKSPS